MVPDLVVNPFPRLTSDSYKQTSSPTPDYNCIAWAAGEDDRWWWPDAADIYYWPEQVVRAETVDAFVQSFALLGYCQCETGQYENGFEKVVLYQSSASGKPTHMSRQLADGSWTSKLGQNIDINHYDVSGLCGPAYGEAVVFMKRPA